MRPSGDDDSGEGLGVRGAQALRKDEALRTGGAIAGALSNRAKARGGPAASAGGDGYRVGGANVAVEWARPEDEGSGDYHSVAGENVHSAA